MSTTNLPVYTGVWTNWTHGAVYGLTLTLNNRTGPIFVAFLAMYVQVVGSHFWQLLAFIIFRVRFKNPTDGLHLQHEAILRNAGSGVNALMQIFRTGWAWRGRTRNPLLRSSSYGLPALFSVLAFATAGFFSSWVTKTTSEVLVAASSQCGAFTLNNNYGFEKNTTSLSEGEVNVLLSLSAAYQNVLFTQSATYTASCIPSNSCTTLAGQRMPKWSFNITEECPFADGICANQSIIMDSGVLDSLLDYGINTREEDRVGQRVVLKCAPLKTKGYTSGWIKASDQLSTSAQSYLKLEADSSIILFFYGASNLTLNDNPVNFTYLYAADTIAFWNRSTWGGGLENSAFFLDNEFSTPGSPDSSTFTAIPALTREYGLTSLTLLALAVDFLQPVHDPWFRAELRDPLGDHVYYTAEWPVNTIGCLSQYQYCRHDTGECTDLDAMSTHGNSGNASLLTDGQYMVWERMAIPIVTQISQAMGSERLLVQQYCEGLYCAPIPDNQWMIEFKNYFNLMIASSQLNALTFASGPPDPQYEPYWAPATEGYQWMCDSQIIVRTDYASFSLLGVILIIAIGGVIILVNLSLESIITWVERAESDVMREWRLTSIFQLQKLALDGLNNGNWNPADDRIPVSDSREQLRALYRAVDLKGSQATGIEAKETLPSGKQHDAAATRLLSGTSAL